MSFVGRSIPKTDGMAIATGKPVYTDDLSSKDALIVKILKKSTCKCNNKKYRYIESYVSTWSRMCTYI